MDAIPDSAARSTARGLVRAVMLLHADGLADLLAIVREAGSQSAETLLPKFAANPKVCGLLLLHDLHPQDLLTRVAQAVDRLRPHLGVLGVRADLAGVEEGVVRVVVATAGQKTPRPTADDLRDQIETAVLAVAPDAAGLVIDGLDAVAGSSEVFVPVSSIKVRGKSAETVAADG
jgi:outer membrane receptor protein involved in Fe transport